MFSTSPQMFQFYEHWSRGREIIVKNTTFYAK